MSKAQFAMIMFTLIVIIVKVSPKDQSAVWQLVAGAYFITMIIHLISGLIEYGKKQQKDKDAGDKGTKEKNDDQPVLPGFPDSERERGRHENSNDPFA